MEGAVAAVETDGGVIGLEKTEQQGWWKQRLNLSTHGRNVKIFRDRLATVAIPTSSIKRITGGKAGREGGREGRVRDGRRSRRRRRGNDGVVRGHVSVKVLQRE